jgi:hypothetical protein
LSTVQEEQEITKDDIDEALKGEQRLRNSYFSMSDYLKKFHPTVDRKYEPVGGTIIFKLWSRGRLTAKQSRAWSLFWNDLQASSGDSGGLGVSYSERVCTSVAGVARAAHHSDEHEKINAKSLSPVRMAKWNAEFTRANEIWESLSRRQKGLAEQLIRDHLRCSGGNKDLHSHEIKYIASFLSGYQDGRQAGAYGVCMVHDLLERLSEFYC